VAELAAGRAVIAKRILGTALVRLENEFADGPAGATYVSRLTIGDGTPLGRLLLNRVAQRRAFPSRRIGPWIRHHVEEVGNLENFLPGLFGERAEVEP
jgi:hypothetical protein